MLTLEEKKTVVSDVAAVAGGAHSAIAAEYLGMTVSQLTQLRREAREARVDVRVVKNTLARRALEGTAFDCMRDSLSGPLLLAFSLDDPTAAARVIDGFSKGNERLVVKVIALGGRLMSPQDVKALATMPTRDEALAKLMAVMKAPIEKLARTLAAPLSKLVRTVAAVRDQKQG